MGKPDLYRIQRITHKPGTPSISVSITKGNLVELSISSVEDPEHEEWAQISASDAQRVGEALLRAAKECGS